MIKFGHDSLGWVGFPDYEIFSRVPLYNTVIDILFDENNKFEMHKNAKN